MEQGVLTAEMCGFYGEYSDFLRITSQFTCIACENFARSIPDYTFREIIGANAHTLPVWTGDVNSLCEDIKPLIAEGYFCVILAGTMRAGMALEKDLQSSGINGVYCKGDVLHTKGMVAIVQGHLSAGVSYPFAKFAIFTSRRQGEEKKSKKPKKNIGLTSLEDIKPGDYVVHQNHGIGQYICINTLDLQGVVKDYIKIAYDKGDTLYVPVTQLDLISRYTAPDDSENVKLAKLGGMQWQASKAKVKKATEEMAKELIELYAHRQVAKGYSFPEDSDWQRDFETRFEYDETDDQLRSVCEIKKDMESPYPMDRLLCGDVGVGKTEVALRAAFKCVMGGKQCAILVPTTILAWQHYETLSRRMASFPVQIGLLSRFRT
ncbi:MAG: CarD family transcriptional regulator, partial [Oscillospiraceae bacterium]